MSPRGLAAVAGILALAIVSSWSVARWRRSAPEAAERRWPRASSPEEIAEAVAILEGSPAYRGVLEAAVLRSAHASSPSEVLVDLDPRELLGGRPELRRHPSLLGALPSVALGRIQRVDPLRVEESWRLACPAGCALDLLDRDPPAGAPSAAWSVRPPACRAIAWFALDARRLADPELGGAGLAPVRERVLAVERLLNRPIRTELAAGLAGTGVVLLEEREGGRAPRLLVALDLARSDRAREVVDLAVSLAAVAGRGEVRRHRNVAVGLIGAPPRRAAIAIDGPLLLVSDDPAAVIAAIDRRRERAGAVAEPPPSFARFRGSWRAERALPAPVTVTLQREGPWWWLRGEGESPAVTADPLLPALRGLLAAR